MGNTVAQPAANLAKGIPKNTTIVVSLKYLSNFWKSIEMPLINWKVELKRRSTKHCVFSVLGNTNNNTNADLNNINFTMKDTKIYISLLSLYQQETTKNY